MGVRGWRGLALAAVVLIAARVVMMTVVPVFEPSEARYAAISANMARTGDFVVPRFTYDLEYQSFDGKPPLVFQAGGLCCWLLGTEAAWSLQLAVRVFPFFSALLLLALVYRYVRVTADRETALLAVAVCGTSTAFYVASGIAMTDITLACAVAGALMAYDLFARAHRLLNAVEVAILLGVGMIAKGPVALALFGIPVMVDAVVNHRFCTIFRWQWLAAMPAFLLVAAPWFVLVEQRNPGAVWYFFYNENFLRFVSHDYGDRYGAGREAFRGVSVLWALAATLPWSLMPLWLAFRKMRGMGVRAALDAVQWRDFAVLSLLGIVGFWCLTSRVLVYYLFPVIPLFAIALAKSVNPARIRALVPWCAGVTLLVTAGSLAGGMFFSEKMMGARTPFDPMTNHYANEFYHGTKPPEFLARERERRDRMVERVLQRYRREHPRTEGK